MGTLYRERYLEAGATESLTKVVKLKQLVTTNHCLEAKGYRLLLAYNGQQVIDLTAS